MATVRRRKTLKPILKKALWGLVILLLLWVVASFALIQYLGAWNLIFPSHQHEEVAPTIPSTVQSPAILLFTKTNSFRHTEAIDAGSIFFADLAKQRNWTLFHTENSAVFSAGDLARFDVVMFFNVSGDVLSQQQQQSFQAWLRAGGGWFGVHSSGDGSHKDWPWYVDNLIGAEFTAHPLDPQFQVARMSNERPDHPIMRNLPTSWDHEEEWYSWEESPRSKGFNILASIDEETYSPVQKIFGSETDLHMGDHPVVWYRCVDGGRAIYSALGHQAAAYEDVEHQRLLENAIVWAMDASACPDKN
jgi:type 1 glutamine amidotransferase